MSNGDTCTFAGFTLDTRRQLLVRGNEPIRLRPRSYDVLAYLVVHAERLVSKQS
jgi:DNA-binding winged helix-turn-helix (wHTH) protein